MAIPCISKVVLALFEHSKLFMHRLIPISTINVFRLIFTYSQDLSPYFIAVENLFTLRVSIHIRARSQNLFKLCVTAWDIMIDHALRQELAIVCQVFSGKAL